jgi:hypothetical protein
LPRSELERRIKQLLSRGTETTSATDASAGRLHG